MVGVRSGLALSVCALLFVTGCVQSTSVPAPAPPPPAAAGGVPGPMGPPPAMGPAALPQWQDAPVAFADGKVALSGSNTNITFVGTKNDGQHEGGFKTLTGTVDATEDGKGIAKISLEIETDSLWSDNPQLTSHLKNTDFFDVKEHPKATFVTTEIAAVEGASHTHNLTGDLTLHGVTKSITVPATVTSSDAGWVLKSTFKIERKDFGMEFGLEKVNNEVSISVAIGVAQQ